MRPIPCDLHIDLGDTMVQVPAIRMRRGTGCWSATMDFPRNVFRAVSHDRPHVFSLRISPQTVYFGTSVKIASKLCHRSGIGHLSFYNCDRGVHNDIARGINQRLVLNRPSSSNKCLIFKTQALVRKYSRPLHADPRGHRRICII